MRTGLQMECMIDDVVTDAEERRQQMLAFRQRSLGRRRDDWRASRVYQPGDSDDRPQHQSAGPPARQPLLTDVFHGIQQLRKTDRRNAAHKPQREVTGQLAPRANILVAQLLERGIQAVLADMYMTQACEYLFACLEAGYIDVASLANGPELALLFDDPGFAAIADSAR